MASKKVGPHIDSAPPDEFGHFRHHFSITFELEHHPFFMATAAIGVIILIAYLFAHLRSGSTSSNSNNATTGSSQPTPATVVSPQIYEQFPTNQPGVPGQPGQSPTTPKTYTITAADMKLGGTLHKIADRFGISYDQLWTANTPNPLGTNKNKATFKEGTILTIP